VTDKIGISLLNLPPTPRQTRMAVGVSIALLAGLGLCAPFADTPLRPIEAFIPTLEAAVIITDFITSILLFSQGWISRSRALIALASGYLFTALIVLPHMLTFPGAFSPTGLLGAGPQTAGWLYVVWHFGLPVAMLVYASLKDAETSTQNAAGWSVAIVIGLAGGLTVLATAGERMLPPVFLDAVHLAPLARYVIAFNALLCAAVLVIFWRRGRSVLDQWLMVVAVGMVSELVMNGLLIGARFTFGWYASRMFSIITSTIVLVVLLDEVVRLYARIAETNASLTRERNNRLMNLEALTSAIAHEIRSPLTGIASSGGALRRYLATVPPKLQQADSLAERMIAATHRISEILDDIGKLFGSAEQATSRIDVNALLGEALRILDMELKAHNVVTRVEMTTELSLVRGRSGQLQEVIVNLLQNAIEAMDAVADDSRVLQVKTEPDGRDAIRVTIADTGPGVDPKKSGQIFDAFFTTKPQGMGLGLAICRMIVERHGGQLSVSSSSPKGAIFHMKLPRMESPDLPVAAAA
jgi:signal transduction histidine kinase